MPAQASLEQNYPNPFNSSTAIGFSLAEDVVLDLGIYDVTGRRIRTLLVGWRSAGVHSVVWDGRDAVGKRVASGVYLYRLLAGDETEARRLLLLK